MRPERSFRLITVGNLGGERRKWLSYFEDVTVVVYVASLADYDRCIGGNVCSSPSVSSARACDDGTHYLSPELFGPLNG